MSVATLLRKSFDFLYPSPFMESEPSKIKTISTRRVRQVVQGAQALLVVLRNCGVVALKQSSCALTQDIISTISTEMTLLAVHTCEAIFKSGSTPTLKNSGLFELPVYYNFTDGEDQFIRCLHQNLIQSS
eukprot:m.225209 g.225209  ORF g.225209 m.225209 type:complete len:130 (-) comp33454_c4_seq2:237-626(-)